MIPNQRMITRELVSTEEKENLFYNFCILFLEIIHYFEHDRFFVVWFKINKIVDSIKIKETEESHQK